MNCLSLVLNYSSALAAPSIGLEQAAVVDGSLTTTDLYKMVSLAKNGVSAKLYRPDTCEVSVVDGQVLVDLDLFVWPKPLGLDHTIASNIGTLSPGIEHIVDREFDFIINFSRQIELPFVVSSISYELTQLPFFDSSGNVVQTPSISFDDRYAYVDSDVVGVIRIKCRAIGLKHTLSLAFDKNDSDISGVNITASATYTYNDELLTSSLTMELPGCVELLLSSCEDTLLTEYTYGIVKDKSELIPVVYYSDCDGSFLALRYEKP